MNLIVIDPESDVPPYEQVRMQVAALVAAEELMPGQKLPTVRQLATDLGLAANTVARSYRELEADGVITTQGRRGTFVRSEFLESKNSGVEASAAAAAFASTARAMGLSLAESTRLLEDSWSPKGRTS